MQTIKTIAVLAPIIIALIAIKNEWLSWRISKRKRVKRTPSNQHPIRSLAAKNSLNQKGLSRKSWFILLVSLLCMAYVLPEVFSPGELTRMAVYKIVMGIGLFFFLLIQTSISNAVETIFQMKTADLGLIEAFLTNQKIRD